MSPNLRIGLALALIGFAVLIIGSLGYMRVFGLNEIICYLMMGIGIAMMIAAMVIVGFMKDIGEHAEQEE